MPASIVAMTIVVGALSGSICALAEAHHHHASYGGGNVYWGSPAFWGNTAYWGSSAYWGSTGPVFPRYTSVPLMNGYGGMSGVSSNLPVFPSSFVFTPVHPALPAVPIAAPVAPPAVALPPAAAPGGMGALPGGQGPGANGPPAKAPAAEHAAAGKAGFGVLAGGDNPPAAPVHVRTSNDLTRSRATHFIELGDNYFHKQRYRDAVSRYRDATLQAPDMAKAFFREGFADAALGQYANAAKAFKRGLLLADDWPVSGFRLDDLYGVNRIAKEAHRETLAQAAIDRPQEAELLFVLAVELFCDGDRERSRLFFERAKTLETGDPSYLVPFIQQLAPSAGEKRDPGAI